MRREVTGEKDKWGLKNVQNNTLILYTILIQRAAKGNWELISKKYKPLYISLLKSILELQLSVRYKEFSL